MKQTKWWDGLKFPRALFVPFSSQGPNGGPDKGYVVPKSNGRGTPVYEEGLHGTTKGRSGEKNYQCFCPECGKAPLTLVGKFKAAGTSETESYFRTVTSEHQPPHSEECPLRVLDSEDTSSPVDFSRPPTLALNIKKSVLGRVDRHSVGAELTRTVVHWDRVARKFVYDETIKNCERFRAKTSDELALACAIMPEDRLAKMKVLYNGHATPWSHVNVGKLTPGHRYFKEGQFDPLDELIRNQARGIQYPVLLHISLPPSHGKMRDGRLRFSMDNIKIHRTKADGTVVRKDDIIPLIHVRDPDLHDKFRKGGEFTIVAVPYINKGFDEKVIFLNIDVRDPAVVSDLGADGFSKKLGATPKRTPRIEGDRGENPLVGEKPLAPIPTHNQRGFDF